MKKLFLTVVVSFQVLLTLSFAEDSPSPAHLIIEGDSEYLGGNVEAALQFYEQALALDPQNYEACWKLARSCLDVGGKLTQKESRLTYCKRAEGLAQKAIELNPEGEKGHLYLCIELGQIAPEVGLRERVAITKEIKIEVDKVLELDPNDDVAWHILGRWNLELANLNWIEVKLSDLLLGSVPRDASLDKAKECFLKAIEINPDVILHHFQLGLTYEDLNEKDLAIAEFQKVADLKPNVVMDKKRKTEAEKHLNKLSR